MHKAFRLLVTALLGLGAGLAAVVAGAAPAHACSCAQVTEADQLSGADAVFTGRLVDRKEAPAAADGSVSSGDPTTLTFAVDRVYKGEVLARQPVRTARSGASCGWELSGEGPYLVFASRQGAVLRTGLCEGNRTGAAPAAWGAGTAPKPVTPGPTAAGAPSPDPSSAPSSAPAGATPGPGGTRGLTPTGFWDVGAPGVAVAAALVLLAGLLNLPRPLRDE